MPLLLLLLLLFPLSSSAVERPSGPVIVHDFVATGNAGTAAVFSKIVPQSVAKELQRLGYTVTRVESPGDASAQASEAAAVSASYIITGSFSLNEKRLVVESRIFVASTGRTLTVAAEQPEGPMLSAIIGDISGKTAGYIDRYIPRMTAEPVFDPSPKDLKKKGTVSIRTAEDDTEVLFTTNGTDPDRDKNPKHTNRYTAPLTIGNSTTFRAVAQREGWYPSSVVEAAYRIDNPYRTFFFTVAGGVGTATGAWEKRLEAGNSLSVKMNLGFNIIPALSENGFFRNLYFLTQFDSFSAETKEWWDSGTETMLFNTYAVSGGLMYRIRLGSYFFIEPDFCWGYSWNQLSQDYDGVIAGLIKKPSSDEQKNEQTAAGSVSTGMMFGRFAFGINVSYRWIDFSHDPLYLVSYNAFVSLRF